MKQEQKYLKFGKRRLKVYEKYLSRSQKRFVILPEIRLCGKWLQDIGFSCGQSVIVHHVKNKIVITLKEESNS